VSTTAASFYQTGGTLRADAPSYVERQADRDLYEEILSCDTCDLAERLDTAGAPTWTRY
jgi:hypothetical protein